MSKLGWAGAVVASGMLLNGCGGGFFIDSKSSTTTTSTGNYIYAVNPSANTINEYTITSGALAAVSGSPVTATSGLAAASVAVSRVNTFVWVGGAGAISSYTIGSTGALTLAAPQAASANASFVSLETSPDGKWLLALDKNYSMLYVYGINTSTGALTVNQSFSYAVPGAGTSLARMLRISPNAAYVAVALGNGGDLVYAFNTSTGLLSSPTPIVTPLNNSDNAVQFDATSAYLYVARVGASTGLSTIQTFNITGTSSITPITSIATGNAPGGLLLDYNNVYLYSANAGASTITGFSVGVVSSNSNSNAGTLTPLAVAAFSNGPAGSLLVEDKTHAYVVSTGASGGADVTLFKFDAITVGNLDAVGTATSGTAGISGLAATH